MTQRPGRDHGGLLTLDLGLPVAGRSPTPRRPVDVDPPADGRVAHGASRWAALHPADDDQPETPAWFRDGRGGPPT